MLNDSFISSPFLLPVNSVHKKILLGYRKDIDGLRAIAILLVVFYHLFGATLSGGFIGVDIFFVISGYLISLHIVTALISGQFSMKEFYIRRLRRIFPVFILVLLIVNLIGFFILIPTDLNKLSVSSLFAVLSITNLYFWKYAPIGYFHSDATVLPLLHTWSLGLEEQFYLIWPAILFCIFSCLKKRGVVDEQKLLLYLGTITIILAFGSYSLCYYFSLHQNMVFYSLPTRGFELLLGGGLALYSFNAKPYPNFQLFFCAILGLAMIAYASIFFSQDDYSSRYSLFPCIGTLLLIHSGRSKSNIISQILSLKYITFFGLISYSLYLWHWPLIAYTNYLGLTIDITVGLTIFFVSVFLSCLSYVFIEKPYRNNYKFSIKKSIFLFIIIPLLIISIFTLLCQKVSNFGFNQINPRVVKAINDYYGPYKNTHCIDSPSSIHPAPIKNCSIGDLNLDIANVLVVGDSHAMALAGMLNTMLNNAHLKGYLVTQSATPFLVGNMQDWGNRSPLKRNSLISKMIKKNHYSYVVLGGYWNYYPDSILKNIHLSDKSYDELKKGIEGAINAVVDAHSIPVLILDVPPLLRVPMQCGFTRIGFHRCYNLAKDNEKKMEITKNILLSMTDKYPKLLIIDPSLVICPNGECVSSIKGTPLYHTGGDNSHLNYKGSTILGKLYLQKIGNPFI